VRALAVVLGLAVAGCSSGNAAISVPVPVHAPATISARVVLPARTMKAGSSMPGQLVVDNNTGRAVRTSGCLGLFQVALVSGRYHPSVAWLACLQFFTIPEGQSSYPVTVAATYLGCGQGGPGGAACLPGGHPPGLPPGTYRAVLFQAQRLFPAPPAITIHVIRR
jgi:hypothetical protein